MAEWLTKGNTAVITGGASGIGLAAANVYLDKGLCVVIADADGAALESAHQQLQQQHNPANIRARVTDVTDYDQLLDLRDFVTSEFGPVHCLMNNAGTSIRMGQPWEDLDSLKRQIDINFWGVVHGCHAFLPDMIQAGQPAAVINTGSKQGMTKPPGNYGYNLSKTGVIGYTESIARGFRETENCRVTAHLLIPGFTYTGMISKFLPEKPDGAWTPEQVVDFMLNALQSGDFYVLCPDNETPRELDEKRLQWNTDDLIKNRPALSRWHPDFADQYNNFVK